MIRINSRGQEWKQTSKDSWLTPVRDDGACWRVGVLSTRFADVTDVMKRGVKDNTEVFGAIGRKKFPVTDTGMSVDRADLGEKR